MKRIVATALFLSIAACNGDDQLLSQPLVKSGPHVVAEHLVWVNQSAGSVVWLDPSDASNTPRAVHIDRGIDSVAVAGANVLLLDADRRRPELEVVAIPNGDVTRLPLETPFERALISPTGAYAILLHDARLAVASNVAAQNHNEVAVVDVSARTVVRIALDTESTSPRNVVFAADESRAAIVLDAAVVVVDLTDPERRLKVPLVLPGGVRLTPEEVIFSTAGDRIYLRANGTPDVLVLTLREAPDLAGFVNFLSVPGAGRLLDIDVASDDPERVVAVFTTTSSQGSIAARLDVDGDISKTDVVDLTGAARRITSFDAETVLVHGGSDALGFVGSNFVAAWDLERDRVEEDRLGGPTMGPPAVGGSTAFFVHSVEGGVASALTALSIERSGIRLGVELRPVVIGGTVKSYISVPEDENAVLGIDITRAESGAAPTIAGFPAEPLDDTGALVVVRSSDLQITTVTLDDPIEEVGVVGDNYFAVHPSDFGDVTVVPRASPSREGSWRFDGVLLTGLLDRTEVAR